MKSLPFFNLAENARCDAISRCDALMDAKSVTGAVPKIRLRINVPESDAFATDATTIRSSKATAGGGECDSRSVSELQSMSLGDDYGDDDGTTMGGTFLSPPTTSKCRDGRSGRPPSGPPSSTSGGDGTPMSIERAPSPASKRQRMCDDWVEDEVHPSKVWSTPGGPAGKWMMSEVMASTMRRALHVDDVGDSTWTSSGGPVVQQQSSISLLKRTLSGTYDASPSWSTMGTSGGGGATGGDSANATDRGDLLGGFGGAGLGLPPSSPSDPSPLHDLRKAALMRSRLLNASGTAGVGGAALPPRATRRSPDGV